MGGGARGGICPPLKKFCPPLSQRDLPHILSDVFMLPPKISRMCCSPPPTLVKLSEINPALTKTKLGYWLGDLSMHVHL